jgi:hypothetical protein
VATGRNSSMTCSLAEAMSSHSGPRRTGPVTIAGLLSSMTPCVDGDLCEREVRMSNNDDLLVRSPWYF